MTFFLLENCCGNNVNDKLNGKWVQLEEGYGNRIVWGIENDGGSDLVGDSGNKGERGKKFYFVTIPSAQMEGRVEREDDLRFPIWEYRIKVLKMMPGTEMSN